MKSNLRSRVLEETGTNEEIAKRLGLSIEYVNMTRSGARAEVFGDKRQDAPLAAPASGTDMGAGPGPTPPVPATAHTRYQEVLEAALVEPNADGLRELRDTAITSLKDRVSELTPAGLLALIELILKHETRVLSVARPAAPGIIDQRQTYIDMRVLADKLGELPLPELRRLVGAPTPVRLEFVEGEFTVERRGT